MAQRLFRTSVAAALLGGAAALRARALESDACACKSWSQVYNGSTAIKCGLTNEYYSVTGKHSLRHSEIDKLSSDVKQEFCTRLYEAIPDSTCLNVANQSDVDQWCYVDSDCTSLAGGEQLNALLSWKVCSPEKDRMTRFMSPPELALMADAQGMDFELLKKMSYPVASYRWKYISSFWDATLDELVSLPKDLLSMNVEELKEDLRPRWGKRNRQIDANMTADLERIKASGVPTLFHTAKDQLPPHVIVQGRTVYVSLATAKPAALCVYGCSH